MNRQFAAFCLSLAALAAVAGADVALPCGTAARAPVACAPFPDRMSAYVWRNWFLVPHDRLAATVGAAEAELEKVAAEMGLPAKVDVLPAWRRQGYITVLRRNWHLLDYPQMLKLLGMTRRQLYFSLMEDDFLWHKLGQLKPSCGELAWDAAAVAAGAPRRRQIAAILREEGADDFSEQPRFAFVDELKRVDGRRPAPARTRSPFDLRLIFSYFADYGDPLGDPEVGSYPEGLLEKLAAQGVNAVWLHTVLNTLAKDPKYPEFGAGCENRLANLRKLVARAARYGIRVYLYMNEPRAQPPAFFEANEERRALKGVSQKGDGTFTMCTSCPETRRWMREATRSVFAAVPGLGGIFTISMSENLTNCASRGGKAGCPRCRNRSIAEIVAEVNRTLVEGMRAANPQAEALVWNWAWPDGQEDEILKALPADGCRMMAVSEGKMEICRGGVKVRTHDYSISCVGPSEMARSFWTAARARGFRTMAKVQANTTWEIAAVPYLPVMELVAEHAANLVKAGVDGVMLSWSLGCLPAPNLRVYNEMDASGDVDKVLDAIACDLYGGEAVPSVRKAWRSFSDGFRSFPFDIGVVYLAPLQVGCANPLYWEKTGYLATMVGIPYDDARRWCGSYPMETWKELMQKVADGFERGCGDWKAAVAAMGDAGKRAFAENEYGIFRTAALHFASVVDQVRFVQARDAGDAAAMAAIAARELARAKEELALARADSRIGYESSNHYFFVPQDLREKILSCRIAPPGRGKRKGTLK